MDAPSPAVRYPPYDVPLQLAGALRRWARPGRLIRWYHVVPGCVLLGRPVRSRDRASTRRVPRALLWRLARGAAAGPSPTPEAPITGRAASIPPTRNGRGLAPSAARAARSPLAAGASSGSRARQGDAARPLALLMRAGGTVPALPDWTRLRRTRERAVRASAPLPATLVVARTAPGRPGAGMPAGGGSVALRLLAYPGNVAVGAPADQLPTRAAAGGPPATLTAGPGAGPVGREGSGGGGPVDSPGLAVELTARAVAASSARPLPAARGEAPAGEGRASGPRPPDPSASPRLAWRVAVAAAPWPQLTHLVERTVEREVASLRSAVPAMLAGVRPGRRPAPDGAGAPGVVTEQLVDQVVSRLRALSREERFRTGRLR